MGYSGYYPDEGKLIFEGDEITHLSIFRGTKLGITFAWQKPAGFEGLTVGEHLKCKSKNTNREIEMIKITMDTTLGKILEIREAKSVLSKYGLPCLHCPMAALEMGRFKIGEIANMYGIEIDKLLNELNEITGK